jgi:DNA-binding response OmpR family regulator
MSKRILVIEDEPSIRTYLQKVLQRAGYDTVAAPMEKRACRWCAP